ncbi:tyrosine-protein phosphatase [Prescottella sp. R16]|uniref:tyrosine-protein phosphatase n=1 Tax=Prescottella sp. R16 TaxID=3064529 RepID=UPI00272E1E48|nr:tyrosine-protein phosphatase [Prescottella sp. R16]
MTHRSTALRRTTRTAVALTASGSFLFAGTAAAGAAGSLDLPALGSIGAGSSAPAVAETPRLATIDNFRDVAGPGYETTQGLRMRPGVFYRSNAVVPGDDDLAALETLGLSAIYDVRTDEEVAGKPDRLPAGASYVRVPILSGDLAGAAFALQSPDEGREFMREMNRSFVNDPAARAGFATLLTGLADTTGPQLFHCTAGKDRTGWAAALLQTIAGVPRDTVMADYLLTNEYTAASMETTLQGLATRYGQERADIFAPMIGVDASYLQASFDEVETEYGTIDNYLRDGLGLSDLTLAKLKLALVL